MIDFKGNILAQCDDYSQSIKTIAISKDELNKFRAKFPVWKDADAFTIL